MLTFVAFALVLFAESWANGSFCPKFERSQIVLPYGVRYCQLAEHVMSSVGMLVVAAFVLFGITRGRRGALLLLAGGLLVVLLHAIRLAAAPPLGR